ncbi:RNA-binding protein 25-like [Homarus americanus]|uniref:RNA-binding protein 25-like n=1 Tax=Homarus americanus TaxID=6706 RepID=UPI001C44073F|nr:RNA-binding protein 25-like [Homarus americanus]
MAELEDKRVRKVVDYSSQMAYTLGGLERKWRQGGNASGNCLDNERKDNKEKSRHDRERHREHEKDRDKDRKKGHKDKKYRDRDRDKKDRDKKGRGDGEKKERDKDRDKRDKGRDRDKHTREKDKSRNQNGKEEDRSEKRERERESKESTHDKDTTHNAEKRDGDEEEKENKSTPENNKYHPMTSSQSSLPSRPPKPRLTIDEKMFQRQLEEALILSRLENKGNSCEKDTKLDTETTHGEEVAVTSTVPDVSGTPETDSSPSLLNNYVPDMDTEETTKPPPHPHDEAVTTGANTTVVELNSDVLQVKNFKVASILKKGKTGEPQPSTSTGFTGKRQRKSVKFKEGKVFLSSCE